MLFSAQISCCQICRFCLESIGFHWFRDCPSAVLRVQPSWWARLSVNRLCRLNAAWPTKMVRAQPPWWAKLSVNRLWKIWKPVPISELKSVCRCTSRLFSAAAHLGCFTVQRRDHRMWQMKNDFVSVGSKWIKLSWKVFPPRMLYPLRRLSSDYVRANAWVLLNETYA